MKGAAAASWLFVITGCCWPTLAKSDLYAIDLERVPPEAKDLFERPALVVQLPGKVVDSAPEVYDFLLQELPFTAACARALGRGRYVILRENERFVIDDRQGLVLNMRRLYRDDVNWVFLGRATYASALGKVEGDALTVIAATTRDRGLYTEARVYCRFDAFFGILAKALPGLFVSAMERKAALFVEAARVVCEESRRDSAGFLQQVGGAEGVDSGVLENFRRTLLNR